jgi:hypothetical protein
MGLTSIPSILGNLSHFSLKNLGLRTISQLFLDGEHFHIFSSSNDLLIQYLNKVLNHFLMSEHLERIFTPCLDGVGRPVLGALELLRGLHHEQVHGFALILLARLVELLFALVVGILAKVLMDMGG